MMKVSRFSACGGLVTPGTPVATAACSDATLPETVAEGCLQ
jgi:hypothetical protein